MHIPEEKNHGQTLITYIPVIHTVKVSTAVADPEQLS